MAESLLKLRVESSEYDAKLANAAKGIRHLADVAHTSAGDLTGLDKSELDYIRALGDMETKSRTASGQVRELSNTYKELKVVYDQLNEVEKADEGGKALAASLETLKQRAQAAKAQLDSATQSLQSNGEAGRGTSGIMEVLKEKFTVNIDAIKLFNIGLQAAEGVLNVVKGAIASTETTYDALARATAVTDSVTNQFLISLANADFSSFINGLQGIIDKAIEAYNVMDEFESYAARFNPKQQAQEAEIQTKLMEARAAKAKGDKDRAEQLTKEAQNLIEELSQTTKAYGEKQTAGGYAVIRSLMGTVDVTDQEIAWYADPKHWEEVKEAAESYRKKQEEIKKLSEGNITAVSYDQHSRTENIRRQREIEASITTRERQAYTFQNLRDSGNSEEAQAFQQALGNIYGTVLANARVSSLKARADRMEGVIDRSSLGGGTTRTGTKTKVAVDVTESLTELQLLEDELKTVENSMKPFGKTSDEWKEMNTYAEELRQRIKDLNGETPQLVEGLNINNNSGLSEYISDLQKQLSTADFATPLYNNLQAQLSDMSTLQSLVGEALKVGLGTALFDVADETGADFWTRAMEGGVKNIDWQAILDEINKARKAAGLDAISLDFATGSVTEEKKGKDSLQDSKTVLNAISQLTSGLESIGVEIPSEIQSVISVMQGVIQVIEAVNAIIGVTQTTALTANTIAMGALTSALWANTATSWIPFAGGGIVPHFAGGGLIGKAALGMTIPGHSYSGDLLRLPVDGGRGMIGVNSGEMILNQAQAGILESELSGGRMRDINVHGVVQGENIVLAVSNYFKRTGKGEAAMWGKN